MKATLFQVDAFTRERFAGNPAAVVALPGWPRDTLLQAVAAENNLSETAFFVPATRGFELRWFTPSCEVDLCGHAILACAHVLFQHLGWPDAHVVFHTRSGELNATRQDGRIVMDFPASHAAPCALSPDLATGLGLRPMEVLATARDYMAIYDDARIVRAMRPDFAALARLDRAGIIVSAPAPADLAEVDFISRFFAPRFGVPEDPVTGSAHCALAPYWAERLGKSALSARQVSSRGGDIECVVRGDRVRLGGHAVTFLTGEIDL